ncbi:hypothetical protein [Ruminococcus sp.]
MHYFKQHRTKSDEQLCAVLFFYVLFREQYSPVAAASRRWPYARGGSPPTLRPNFNCEKGSVTAAAAACSPRRGIFVGENLLYDLRVTFDLVVQAKCELFSFFASFFLFSKEKKKRNSL